MRILAHMAKEKHIVKVLDLFLNIDKGEHEVDYLMTTFGPFKANMRSESLQVTQFGMVNIAYKMETARKVALTMHYDYLFNVEDDNTVPEDALLKLLEAGKDCICGLYRYRPSKKPNTPLMPELDVERHNFAKSDINTGVRKAHLIPWGCTLFSRRTLEKIAFSPGLDGRHTKLCEEAGIDRWVHTDVHVGHIDIASDGSMLEVKV